MIDKVVIFVKAGDGGSGVVSFRREKYVPRGGPDGGNGGKGGSIILQSDIQFNTLRYFAEKQKFDAEAGGRGGKKNKRGRDGEDLLIRVPVGTVVRLQEKNFKDQMVADLSEPNMKVMVAKGGKGGWGNAHFKSSTNRTPRETTRGELGEDKWLVLELKLLADVGLVGLPNAGKSTLLSVLTKAKPKIADYPFTTITPNLGVMELKTQNPKLKAKSLVIADIPGLIEGASEGRGLGDEFLRHVERCKLLVHVVAPDLTKMQKPKCKNQNGDVAEQLFNDYLVVRQELKDYGAGLTKKKEVVVINKIDLLSQKSRAEIEKYFRKKKISVLLVSAATLENIDQLKRSISR